MWSDLNIAILGYVPSISEVNKTKDRPIGVVFFPSCSLLLHQSGECHTSRVWTFPELCVPINVPYVPYVIGVTDAFFGLTFMDPIVAGLTSLFIFHIGYETFMGAAHD